MARENRAKREAKLARKKMEAKRLQNERRSRRLGLSHEMMIDRLINEEWVVHKSSKLAYYPAARKSVLLQQTESQTKDILERSHVVLANNVFDYWNSRKREGVEFEPRMFPGCIPPFDNLWIEFSQGADVAYKKRFGILVSSEFTIGNLGDFASDSFVPQKIVTMLIFIEGFDGPNPQYLCGPSEICQYAIDSRGETNGFFENGTLTSSEDGHFDDYQLTVDHFVSLCVPAAMLAISFMNCSKGVTVSKVDPPTKFDEARAQYSRKPLVRYNTIDIGPMKEVLRTEGGIETNGIKKALHICRGHFATYSNTFMGRKLPSPMTCWVPSHVRGSSKHGVVVSDYNVSPPIQEAAQ